MKKYESVKAVMLAITILCLIGTMFGETILALRGKEYISENQTVLMDSKKDIAPLVAVYNDETGIPQVANVQTTTELSKENVAEAKSQEDIEREAAEAERNKIVYDNMTLDQLSEKLNRSLNSTISGQGYAFASSAIELGIDPYLAVAIVMHETGCKWECSSLLKQCNNVGGMKGAGGCNGGSYASFPSLEEGIRAYMNNLYKNYISQGLTTADAMGPKYAASSTWSSQVNAYINEIKAA